MTGVQTCALPISFDLPGVPQDRVTVEAEDGTLTVTAERERSVEVPRERYHRSERRFGTFARTVGLPQGAATDAIRATFKDGVLEVRVAKPEQVKPRKIEIGFGDGEPQTIEGKTAA